MPRVCAVAKEVKRERERAHSDVVRGRIGAEGGIGNGGAVVLWWW